MRRFAAPALAALMIVALMFAARVRAAPEDAGSRRFDPGYRWATAAVDAPGVEQRSFDSAALGEPVSYHVYLPEQYEAEPERRFPVLYWLHGSKGGLRGVGPLSAHFGRAMRAGLMPPMIVVLPAAPPYSLWVDAKDGARPVETVVTGELVPHIDATFRTIASREGRIVEGFSMGGYGAARLGLARHDLFCAASSLAGGPLQQHFTHAPRVNERRRLQTLQRVFGGDHQYFRELSPWRLAEQNADAVRGRLLLRVVIGAEDEMLAVAREFHAHLTRLAIHHTFTVLPGVGHDTREVLLAMGDEGWEFYRRALQPAGDAADD